jgi:hypothetical protein
LPKDLKSKLRKEDFIGSLDSEILVAVSTDSGNTFSSPVDVSKTAGTLSRSSAIAASKNNVNVDGKCLMESNGLKSIIHNIRGHLQ